MDINDFKTLLEEELNKKLKENERLRFTEVRKNNGILLNGVSVLSGSKKITPTVYIEEHFHSYTEGKPLEEIAAEILKLCRKGGMGVRFDIESFSDFEKAKKRIVFKLINTEKNRELLQEIPGIPFLDLTMVFYYLLGERKACRASILIRNEHVKNWGVDTQTLYAAAKKNLPLLLPVETIDMKSMMLEILKDELSGCENGQELKALCESGLPGENENDGVSMYVMTNREKYFGAAGIACADAIKNAAEKIRSDLYILPSSVHEVILLPASSDLDPKRLKDMVRDVNQTQVSPDEVLSDSVYLYSREKKDFRIVCA